jgi:hypothetical protein
MSRKIIRHETGMIPKIHAVKPIKTGKPLTPVTQTNNIRG